MIVGDSLRIFRVLNNMWSISITGNMQGGKCVPVATVVDNRLTLRQVLFFVSCVDILAVFRSRRENVHLLALG